MVNTVNTPNAATKQVYHSTHLSNTQSSPNNFNDMATQKEYQPMQVKSEPSDAFNAVDTTYRKDPRSPSLKRAHDDWAEKQSQLKNKKFKTEQTKIDTSKIMGKVDDWLKLMCATILYQSPEKPTDPSKMMAQFSNVAQTMGIAEMNQNLEAFFKKEDPQQFLQAVAQVGRFAEIESSKFQHTRDSDHPTHLSFKLPPGSRAAQILVTDQNNQIVQSTKGDFMQGKNTWAWNGQDNEGCTMPSGVYHIRVQALDASGQTILDQYKNPVNITTNVTGLIEKVEKNDGEFLFNIGSVSYPMTHLVSMQSSAPTHMKTGSQTVYEKMDHFLNTSTTAQTAAVH